MRSALALLAATATAALGALLLGEYDFTGWTPFVAGVLFGVVVAEAAVVVGRRRGPALAAATGVLSGAGLLWAVWISSDHWIFVPRTAWVAVAIGPVAAATWFVRSAGPRAADNPPEP